MARLCIVSVAVSALAVISSTAAPAVTFSKDVQPILQNHCQECHRPGQVAPMSLLSYKEARPWAKSIRQAVATKKMPPWFADPHYGKFVNDRSLSQADIDTLVAWVDAGAPEGNPKDAPAPRTWPAGGWNAGEPDLVVEAPVPFNVPATGEIPYQWVIVPTNLKEDKWVVSAEIMPGNRAVIHHIVTSIREPGNPWMSDKKPGEYFSGTLAIERGGKLAGSPETMGGYFAQYEPGSIVPPANPHVATLLKAGSDIVFQIHYTPNGKATTDQVKIGFIFSDRPPDMKYINVTAINPTFTIPPGDPNYKIQASATVNFDGGELVSIYPHAHLRGKAYEFHAVYPTGEEETLLKCDYNFNWQLTYVLAKPKPMPKGTKILVTAWYDNSANNRSNPDPTKAVRWGEQSSEEMMISTAVFKVPNKPAERASQ